MDIITILSWLKNHKNIVSKAILGLVIALSISYGVVMHNQNKKLSQGLEMADNNIEAYQDAINNSDKEKGVLKLNVSQLQYCNDSLLNKLDSIREQIGIKSSAINTAATQTQRIYVKKNKGVRGQNIIQTILKDTTYIDSIQYNNLTKIYYTIGKDTVSVSLDFNNTQYLYIYKIRQYKHKKSFIKRLFTLDFKKVDRYKYNIVNTNDLLKTSGVRVVESTNK